MENLSEIKFIEWSNSILPSDYDVEFVKELITSSKKRPVRILDVGGGNGEFASAISAQSIVTVIDKSSLARDCFVQNTNTKLEFADFFTFNSLEKFDFIIFKTVLHHFIESSESETLELQIRALTKSLTLLAPDGQLIIEENFYEGVFGSDITAKLIFWLTRSKLLARIVRLLGANTAGEGVRFRSYGSWMDIFDTFGLKVEKIEKSKNWALHFPWWQRVPLLCTHRFQAILTLKIK